ncbi:MAG TPA: adenosine deaminase [Dyella sp.]|uniref:adenosine deaminase family protein n=1 Tax=Dyella sp. TaxID=1869338 RepID=UPI002B567298|nr:adenosine deaminase [Dyella sp.]HUB89257.1 adenosine deaminase [Dyella sp.]
MQVHVFLRRAVVAAAIFGAAQVSAQAMPLRADTATTRTAQAFETARQQGPLALHAFLAEMPKGADLHNHLSGAVYAESWIAQAAADGLCVDVATLSLLDKHDASAPGCGNGRRPAADALSDQHFYDALVDAFSMRSFVPFAGHSGHDQFFDTFGRFQAVTPQQHMGDWLDEVSARAAVQNEQYLELMATPPFAHARELARTLDWQPDFDAMRKQLLARGLKDDMAADEQLLTQALAERKRRQRCGTAQADAGCAVQIRFLYQVLRGAPPARVFAQTLLGFELASADPRWVGINFVMPEDGYLSMRDYSLQMHMLDYLHHLYPKVHVSLHAGELAPGLVPPDGLRFHIREAVEIGHAERIGHGVDVMYEDHPEQLLQEMAARHVMVEINLTSNDVILGVRGADHPLPIYLKHGVPVALSTDDEGVSRIDLTHEYVRAAEDFDLDYSTLKQMARNSLTYSFLPGESLWATQACQGQPPGNHPSASCRQLLSASEKAAAQWELERRLRAFEEAH